jgi:NADPH:quinone reductase-like Zn-dependent oxidoreductase
MRAVLCTTYGPPEVLRLADVETPIPKDDEVRIRVHATTVHVGDTKIRALRPGMGSMLDPLVKAFMRVVVGFSGPRRKILGMELSGEIDAVGRAVTRLKRGDLVFAGTQLRLGAYAEYVCLPAHWAVLEKPVTMTHAEAATVPNGGLTALFLLRKAGVQSGHKVLVYGASGSVGTFAVQLARSFGAEVTGICSGANFELVRSLGAREVIDYTATDFTKNGERYDVIVDAVGMLSRSRAKGSLTPTGRYLNVLRDSGTSMTLDAGDLGFLKELIEAGKLRTVIDRTYRLEDIVEAHRYVDLGHKKGHVVVTVAPA